MLELNLLNHNYRKINLILNKNYNNNTGYKITRAIKVLVVVSLVVLKAIEFNLLKLGR